ncbi:hypothetical protein C8Q80DRAFT_559928 [Daedaleopsis nitida]|nr:hypothetical protein C8Q80DRAFT_559928 [Daedaleopsis nitida]
MTSSSATSLVATSTLSTTTTSTSPSCVPPYHSGLAAINIRPIARGAFHRACYRHTLSHHHQIHSSVPRRPPVPACHTTSAILLTPPARLTTPRSYVSSHNLSPPSNILVPPSLYPPRSPSHLTLKLSSVAYGTGPLLSSCTRSVFRMFARAGDSLTGMPSPFILQRRFLNLDALTAILVPDQIAGFTAYCACGFFRPPTPLGDFVAPRGSSAILRPIFTLSSERGECTRRPRPLPEASNRPRKGAQCMPYRASFPTSTASFPSSAATEFPG